MKLKQPDTYKEILVIDGIAYPKDEKGEVDVPDNNVHAGLYGFGFHRVEEVAQPQVNDVVQPQVNDVVVEAVEPIKKTK